MPLDAPVTTARGVGFSFMAHEPHWGKSAFFGP
jgi:hypothetical protein